MKPRFFDSQGDEKVTPIEKGDKINNRQLIIPGRGQ